MTRQRRESPFDPLTKVDVGYAWQSRFGQSKIHHVVVRNPDGEGWVLLCSGNKGTREYQGWFERAISCQPCVRIVLDRKDEEAAS